MVSGQFESDPSADASQALMVDGNAIAGLLDEIFTHEMTVSIAECAFCGKRGEIGGVRVFSEGPGVVLRCPYCSNVLMRIVRTSTSIYLDARGMAYIQISQ
jgi:hypothetical protein